MRIGIGCDHRGIEFKQKCITLLEQSGHEVKDFGTYTTDSVDYPDVAQLVGAAILAGDYEQGILICGTGIGMSIAGNKIKGIRAALCHNAFCAERARKHNDSNILCMGSEIVKDELKDILDTYFSTDFEGGRHQRRVEKMAKMEE